MALLLESEYRLLLESGDQLLLEALLLETAEIAAAYLSVRSAGADVALASASIAVEHRSLTLELTVRPING